MNGLSLFCGGITIGLVIAAGIDMFTYFFFTKKSEDAENYKKDNSIW